MILDPTDQNIRDQGFNFVPFDRYLAAPFQPSNISFDVNTGEGIPTVFQPRTVSNQNNQMSFTDQGVAGLIDDFTTTTRNKYFDSQPTPLVDNLRQSKLDKTFMGFPSYREQELTGPDLGEYIGTDTNVPLELTRAGEIQGGIESFKDQVGSLMDKAKGFGPISFMVNSLDRFDTLPPEDQAFINMNLGYIGPTVFGENTSGLAKDPYGINTRSMFGNYAEYVRDKADEYDDITDEEYENLSTFRKQKVDFYRRQQKKLAQIEKEKQQQQYNEYVRSGRQAEVKALQARIDRGEFDGPRGPDAKAAEARESYGAEGQYRADGGRVGYMMGGLADLVDIYD